MGVGSPCRISSLPKESRLGLAPVTDITPYQQATTTTWSAHTLARITESRLGYISLSPQGFRWAPE
jgi:hypothetical protein